MNFKAQPWQGGQNDAAKRRLNTHANHPFFLTHYPTSWDFVQNGKTGEWLPHFSELKEAPGINGVQQNKHGVDSKYARVHYSDLGFVILDYKEHDYLMRYPALGGFYYVLKWAVPKQVGKKVFWSLNEEEFNAWRRGLVEEGIIEPPHPEIIELKIDNCVQKINRAIKNQHIPEVKNQIAKWDKEIKIMKASLKVVA